MINSLIYSPFFSEEAVIHFKGGEINFTNAIFSSMATFPFLSSIY